MLARNTSPWLAPPRLRAATGRDRVIDRGGGVRESRAEARSQEQETMKLLRAPDGHVQDRHVGLYPALGALAPQQRERLADILYDNFRPELIKRLRTVDSKAKAGVIDMIIDLTKLKKPIAGWRAVGTPKPADRIWHYHSFDPLAERAGQGNRGIPSRRANESLDRRPEQRGTGPVRKRVERRVASLGGLGMRACRKWCQ